MKWHQVIAVLFSIAVLAAGCGAGCGKEAKAPDDIAFYPVGDTAKEYDLERNGNGEFALCWKEEAAAGMDLCIDNQLTAVVHNVGESQLAMTQAYWYERLDGSRWEAWGPIRGQDDGLLWAAPGEAVAFARALNAKAGEFASCGITLAYHNHHVEFKRFGKETLLELIYANAPQLEGEIDTYWVQYGGSDPVRWITRLAGRMRVLHLKDYAVDSPDRSTLWKVRPQMAPIGSGTLDWERIFEAAEASGVQWYVVEHDADVVDPFDSFEKSMNFLQNHFIQ